MIVDNEAKPGHPIGIHCVTYGAVRLRSRGCRPYEAATSARPNRCSLVGDEVLATTFNMSVEGIRDVLRIAIFVMPPIVYKATASWCRGLMQDDDELIEEGIETGTYPPTGRYDQLDGESGPSLRHAIGSPAV